MKLKEENKGIDISSFTKDEDELPKQPAAQEQSEESAGEKDDVGATVQEVLEELGKEDPALTMVVEQLFLQGETIAKLRQEVEILKRYTTYLIMQDEQVRENVKKAEEAKKAAEAAKKEEAESDSGGAEK